MTDLWPWLAIAGAGALHGASPANGWLCAAACGMHARDDARGLAALRPFLLGQVASIALVAGGLSLGWTVDRAVVREAALASLIAAAAWHLWPGRWRPFRGLAGRRAGKAGLALWSFMAASAQGTALMLVPALAPWCAGLAPAHGATASGAAGLALAAIAVHLTAMLVVAALLAAAVSRGFALRPGPLRPAGGRVAWLVSVAVTGALLMSGGWT